MTAAFNKAWMLLKYKSVEEEERSYGGVSHREHPLYGQEGYDKPAVRGQAPLRHMGEDPMDEEKLRALAEMMEREGIEPPQPTGPPGNIGVAGSMGTPEKPLSPNPFQMKRKPSL